MVLTCITLYTLYLSNNNDLKIANINLIAQSDSIRTYKNKEGETVYKISSLIADKKLLKEINSELVIEIDKLSKKDKKIW